MGNDIKIPIEVSAKHAHLCQEHVDILFGKGYQLTNKAELSQKGYFVANERVEVVGSKSGADFGILLPLRDKSQIEVAITDAIKLGLDIVLRDSGDLEGSGACILRGPEGEIALSEGVIVARRHIHMNDEDAKQLGVKDKDHISVSVDGDRALIFEDVLIRTDPTFSTSMHIDTDEGNAANINNKTKSFGKRI